MARLRSPLRNVSAKRPAWGWIIPLVVVGVGPLRVSAQKAPEMGYLYPPGGRAGTTVDVMLGGFDWTGDMQVLVHDRHVQFTITGPPGDILVPPPPYWFGPKAFDPAPPLPRETPARIVIAPDCPPGPIRWQAANANGVTATGVLMVSHESELIEMRHQAAPQSIASLPTIISGRLGRIEEVDRFRFTAQQTGPVTCSLFARRIGSAFFGVIEVDDADGHQVADAVDTEGWDPELTFVTQPGRDYTVSVRDVDYRGDRSYVYRLELTPGPRVQVARPAAIRRGRIQAIEFIGTGVASGANKLESVIREVAVSSAATETTFDYRLESAQGTAPAFALLTSNLAESVKRSRAAGQPQVLVCPGAVTGVLDSRGAEDVYTCRWKKNELWAIEVAARCIGSTIDPVIVIRDASGKELAHAGDPAGGSDCSLEFSVPADGMYDLAVTDVAGRGGSPTAAYRLAIDAAQPDFQLTANVQHLAIPLGQKAELAVAARRSGGFRGAIRLSVFGLPSGVTTEGDLLIPPDKSEAMIRLVASPDAAATAAAIEIRGASAWEHASLVHPVTAPAAGNLAPRSTRDREIDRLAIATTLKPVCQVEPVDKDGGRLVHRGTTFPAEMKIERLGGFDGPVILDMASQQQRHRQGITGTSVVVPPGVERALFGCYLPEWLETSRTSRMAVIGKAQVKDPQGNVRTSVADVSGQITMTIEGAVLKIAPAVPELTVPVGRPLAIDLKIQRSATLVEPARIELTLADDLEGLFTAQPLVVASGQSMATLQIQPVPGQCPRGRCELGVRATVMQDGRWPVISQTSVPVEFVATRDK